MPLLLDLHFIDMWKLIVIIILLSASTIMAETGRHNEDFSPALVLQISLDKQAYSIGESVTVTCQLRNVSESPIHLPPILYSDLTFRIFDSDNSFIPFKHALLVMQDLRTLVNVDLQPGESHTLERVFGKHDMPEVPGQYRFCAQYENKTDKIDDKNFWVGKVYSECVMLNVEKPE